MDKWYAKDISRKVRMMYKSRAVVGIPIGTPVYGYIRSKANPKYWEADPEAATVVQYIYQLFYRGYGSKQIVELLERGRIMNPSQYRLDRSAKKLQTSETSYRWGSTTVGNILRQQKHCGDVVNFETYSNSYKDKTRRPNAPENRVIFRGIHEPIIERSFWEYIQHKTKNQRIRKKADGQSIFSGFLRCENCGSNLH